MYRGPFLLILCVICMFTLTSCSKISAIDSKNTNIKYVDIYVVVKEAFLTDKEYNKHFSKHITKNVFNHITIYKAYPVNNPEYKKPFKVDFDLKEVSQAKDNDANDLIYVDMIYSVLITDANGKTVGGAQSKPIQFTINTTENEWYIIDKHEAP